MDERITLWTRADARANDILRELMRAAKYPWVYRKLSNARWHLLETHTWKSEVTGLGDPVCRMVTNGEVYEDSSVL